MRDRQVLFVTRGADQDHVNRSLFLCRFRILIIGRANAGKTTIIQKVCKTRENPEIYDSAGKKLNINSAASKERGLHDINNEMVFGSNPRYVFHDSCGFEAGAHSEFDQVKAFITRRSQEEYLENRIHAIWYCIPMDEKHRWFTSAETKFFSQCDTGNIPVIVLFTKFDALYDDEFTKLRDEGVSRKDAKELAPNSAMESFMNGPQVKFLGDPANICYPPSGHVCLANMNEDGADCGPLIERTAEALDDETLKQLIISTQQTNLELCIKYAVERTLAVHLNPAQTTSISADDQGEKLIADLASWFPHLSVARSFNASFSADLERPREAFRLLLPLPLQRAVLYDSDARRRPADVKMDVMDFSDSQCKEIWSKLCSLACGSSTLEKNVQLGSAVILIFARSFHLWDQQRYLRDQQVSGHPLNDALDQYMASLNAAAVREALRDAVDRFCSPQRKMWFNRHRFGSQRKTQFINAIFQAILQHRLCDA